MKSEVGEVHSSPKMRLLISQGRQEATFLPASNVCEICRSDNSVLPAWSVCCANLTVFSGGSRMENKIEVQRLKFKPDRVRVLFVGESAPAGGTFFYFANSNLYEYTQKAFQQVFGPKCGRGVSFLEFFKDHEFFLDDLCLSPVNNLDTPARGLVCKQAIPSLSTRIRDYQPEVVAIVKMDIEHYVRDALIRADLGSVPYRTFPFPAMSYQWRYVAEMAEFLRSLSPLHEEEQK